MLQIEFVILKDPLSLHPVSSPPSTFRGDKAGFFLALEWFFIAIPYSSLAFFFKVCMLGHRISTVAKILVLHAANVVSTMNIPI